MFHPTAHGYFFTGREFETSMMLDAQTEAWPLFCYSSTWVRRQSDVRTILFLKESGWGTSGTFPPQEPGMKRDSSSGLHVILGKVAFFFLCVCVDFPLFLPNLFFTSSYPPARYQPGRVSPLQTAAHAKSQSSIVQLLALFHIHVLIDNHNWLMPPSLPPSPQKIDTTVHFAPLDSRPRIAVA